LSPSIFDERLAFAYDDSLAAAENSLALLTTTALIALTVLIDLTALIALTALNIQYE
jgi:hypothetical protein